MTRPNRKAPKDRDAAKDARAKPKTTWAEMTPEQRKRVLATLRPEGVRE